MNVELSVLLVVLPLLLAFVGLLMKRINGLFVLGAALVNIVLVLLIDNGAYVIGDYSSVIGIRLLINDTMRIGLLLSNGLIFVIALINIKHHQKIFSVLLLSMAALNGMLLTDDLFNLFVFLEIASIAAYLISSLNQKPFSSFQYLVLGTVGGAFFLLGTILLYAMFGTLNITELGRLIGAETPSNLILPMMFIFVGIGVEAKLLPFNTWVKGVLGHSNTLTGPMIAGVYAAVLGFVIGKLTGLFIFEDAILTVLTIWLVAGILLGDVMAFASTRAKEVLLYSSVASASLAVLLFAYQLDTWAINLLIVNALGKTALFLIINTLSAQTSSDKLVDLEGVFKNQIVLGVAFSIITLSIMGMPLFVGFVIKMNYLTLLAGESMFVLIVLLTAALIEGIYFAKLLIKLWDKKGHQTTFKVDVLLKSVVILIAAVMLVFGLIGQPIVEQDEVLSMAVEVINNG